MKEKTEYTGEIATPGHYSDLAEGMAIWRWATRFESLLSGAYHARQNREGDIRLVYTDGSEEIAHWDTDAPDLRSFDTWLGVVSAVQDRARA